MIRDFLLGFIRVHILHHASKEPVYGLRLMEELRHYGYKVSLRTIYPILHKLEHASLLKSDKKLYRGKVRKYYSSTTKGKRTLAAVKKKVEFLVEEVLESIVTGAWKL